LLCNLLPQAVAFFQALHGRIFAALVHARHIHGRTTCSDEACMRNVFSSSSPIQIMWTGLLRLNALPIRYSTRYIPLLLPKNRNSATITTRPPTIQPLHSPSRQTHLRHLQVTKPLPSWCGHLCHSEYLAQAFRRPPLA
jgi:hypothetical protein